MAWGLLRYLLQDLQVVEDRQDHADGEIQTHKDAQQANNNTENEGQAGQETDHDSGQSSDDDVYDDIDDQSNDISLGLERKGKVCFECVHESSPPVFFSIARGKQDFKLNYRKRRVKSSSMEPAMAAAPAFSISSILP